MASGGEGRLLANQVPEELRGYLHKDMDVAGRIDLVEFLNEVGVRWVSSAGGEGEGVRQAAGPSPPVG
ncbi:hypothetical protein ACQPWW_20105 [Micromonospora sp. CA-240977]|uniref:hypothetical protein n=1 Tax=Micromonospora sp. CA-240977 TaxID=3239957 RepID=UPI003D902A7B